MIIIYRDGVGDGQISYVHETEVKLVKVIPIFNNHIFIGRS